MKDEPSPCVCSYYPEQCQVHDFAEEDEQMQELIIAVDFDGTVVAHDYPDIGAPAPGAIDWLLQFQAKGAKVILWTMRSGRQLLEAKTYLEDRGVILFGVNGNPEQDEWTTSPKAYAHVYIDDAALGAPLIHGMHRRPVVDWGQVGPLIMRRINESVG